MNRILKKTISFSLAIIFCVAIFVSGRKIDAEQKSSYGIKVLSENEYSDGVSLGDSYLMLKNGKLNDINENTTFTVIDKEGNKKDTLNGFVDIKYHDMYYGSTAEVYGINYNFFTVGNKDNKRALLDVNGDLYGGENNYYNQVYFAGDKLFYTSDDTSTSSNKNWTLRKKDGTIIKEFTSFDVTQNRVHANGYEYINYWNNDKNELIAIDKLGKVIQIGAGYKSFSAKEGSKYLVASKLDYQTNEIYLTVFDVAGVKVFDVQNGTGIDVNALEKLGRAKVELRRTNQGGYDYCENIIDNSGKLLLDSWKYSSIKSYDTENALININNNMCLVDYSNNIKVNTQQFAKTFGETYEPITFSVYYIDYTLSLDIRNVNSSTGEHKVFMFDKDGEKITEKSDVSLVNFNGKYAAINNIVDGTYSLTDKNLNAIKTIDKYIYLQNGDNGIIAKAYSTNDILILSDGTTIDKYDYISDFKNGHATVRETSTGVTKNGVIDLKGNELIPLGEYSRIDLFGQSDNFIAYKENLAYIFDKLGNSIPVTNQYNKIGDYTSYFYYYTSYNNKLDKNNIAITVDSNNMIGLIKIVSEGYSKEDFNKDGAVDIADLGLLALNYNISSSYTSWDEIFDLVKDNIIDIYDIIQMSKFL